MRNRRFSEQTWKKNESRDSQPTPLTDVSITEFVEGAEFDRKLAAKNAKLEQTAAKAAGFPDYPALLEEAKQIRAQFEKYGIHGSTQLLYVGKKSPLYRTR
jgi:hypothetical protein